MKYQDIIEEYPLTLFLEYTDTTTDLGSGYDITYNHSIYQTGYRYQGRTIGASIDNDGKMLSMGLPVIMSDSRKLSLIVRDITVNEDGNGLHSINSSQVDSVMTGLYLYQNSNLGQFNFSWEYHSNLIDQFQRQNEKFRFGMGWSMML